jgi:hypothetical protein
MGYTIEMLGDVPIVVITAHQYTAENHRPASEAVHKLTQHLPAPIYRISDCTRTVFQWHEMQQALVFHSKGKPGSMSDPRMIPIIVGARHLSAVMADTFRHEAFGGITLYRFNTLHDALSFARNHYRENYLNSGQLSG